MLQESGHQIGKTGSGIWNYLAPEGKPGYLVDFAQLKSSYWDKGARP